MKVCPACRTTFDDSQNFCLNDGTPLVAAETEPETPTVVTPAPPQSNVEYRSYQTLPPTAVPAPAPAVEKKSQTGLLVAGTAIVTLLLIGLGAGGWWMMSRGNTNQAARTNANSNPISNSSSNSAPRPSPSASVANSNASAPNANVPAANSAVVAPDADTEIPPTPAPPPAREIPAKEAAAIRKEVSGTINSWANAIESGNFNGHLSYYADTLDYYYNARGFAKNQVRADKERAFAAFDNIEFNISNIRVTPEAGGDRATVVYDKEWLFENDERSSEGKVQSQLTLQKIGGRWLIVGERDLKVYYQESR